MSQPNSILQIKHAIVSHLELIINWRHILTDKLILRIHDVRIEGELVNRLRNKQEILRDKMKILADDIRLMVEKQV